MHDKHQGSDLSEAAKEVLFYPPPRINFILKNQIVIIKINADCSSADTGERSAFSVFYQPFHRKRRTDIKNFKPDGNPVIYDRIVNTGFIVIFQHLESLIQ